MSVDPIAGTRLPGFIDLQINGAFGHDFTTEPESMWNVGRQLPRLGVTAFLPTIISCEEHQRHAAYAAIRARPDGYVGAKPLGLHLEGPLLAATKAGAHPTAAIAEGVSRFDQVVEEMVANADAVAMVTLAPELPGALAAVERLAQAGIVVSLGHSEASAAEASAAFDAGATAVTHLFNAMAPLHHREVGLVGAALHDDRVIIGLIADNRHVHPSAIGLVWRLVGPKRLALVSDAIAGMAAPPGRYRVGSRMVICDDEARADTGELAGSLLDLPTAAVNLRAAAAITHETVTDETVIHETMAQVLSGTQMRLLGDRHVRAGFEAGHQDVVVVNEDYRPLITYIDGRECWRHPELTGWS